MNIATRMDMRVAVLMPGSCKGSDGLASHDISLPGFASHPLKFLRNARKSSIRRSTSCRGARQRRPRPRSVGPAGRLNR